MISWVKLTVDPVTQNPAVVFQDFWIILEEGVDIGDVRYLCFCLRESSFADLGNLPNLFS